MESKKENNKQILSNALKALRECKEVNDLPEEHRNALNSADADDLYNAYLDIDTYFDKDKCFSIENPCCAYGLCAGGILTTAALCGTVMPCICNSIPTPSHGIPYGPGMVCLSCEIGALVSMAIGPMIAPAAGGVLALCEHKARAEKKEKKINQIADDIKQHNDEKQSFLEKLKKIISFHSYYDTERGNIKNAIQQLCKSKQNYNKEIKESKDNGETINNKKGKNKISI